MKHCAGAPGFLFGKREVAVQAHNQPTEQAFGHEIVVVAQFQIVAILPLQVGSLRGEQVWRQVAFLTPFIGQAETQLELVHQLQQLVAHAAVGRVFPNVFGVFNGEIAFGFDDFGVVEYRINAFRHPVVVEKNGAFQQHVVLKMQEYAKIVQELTQSQRPFIV